MRLAVLTGGGDCAGLNAAIRAVVRTAHELTGRSVIGYRRGWEGVLAGDTVELTPEEVRGILPVGGTMLRTSRSKPGMLDDDGRALLDAFARDGIDALIAIGGEGTLVTTATLAAAGFDVVAVPKTIDNDVAGTEVSIGFNTALTVATDAVDRLHTTADSHDRVMVLEVMGRHAGHLAAGAGMAGGAAAVLVPERRTSLDDIATRLLARHQQGRQSSIVVVAEGAQVSGVGKRPTDRWGQPVVGGVGQLVADEISHRTGFETRATVLGHIQRGGAATATDRLVASRLGSRAVEAATSGGSGYLVGIAGNDTRLVSIGDVAGMTRTLSRVELALLERMTTA